MDDHPVLGFIGVLLGVFLVIAIIYFIVEHGALYDYVDMEGESGIADLCYESRGSLFCNIYDEDHNDKTTHKILVREYTRHR